MTRPVAESFFATLKKELIHRYRSLGWRDASNATGEYIESFYNSTRLHSSGVEVRDDGLLHRAQAAECAEPVLAEPTCNPSDQCQAHVDCTEQPCGFCFDTSDLKSGCEYIHLACESDTDNGPDWLSQGPTALGRLHSFATLG